MLHTLQYYNSRRFLDIAMQFIPKKVVYRICSYFGIQSIKHALKDVRRRPKEGFFTYWFTLSP